MNYCTKCGKQLKKDAKFCTGCGEKVKAEPVQKKTHQTALKKPAATTMIDLKPEALKAINRTIIKNNQSRVVRYSKYVAGFFTLVILIASMNREAFPVHPALLMISIFGVVAALVTGYMFRLREKKLQTLITGESVLASWKLDATQKADYVKLLHDRETSKNKGLFWIIAILMVVIFGIFILVMDEGKGFMAIMLFSILAVIALFAFGMPGYYRRKNMKADGQILIGEKYAYINGFFHNWDFPLSGIKKAEVMDDPFYGLQIDYYYTDRTFVNNESLKIPAPKDMDLKKLIELLNN